MFSEIVKFVSLVALLPVSIPKSTIWASSCVRTSRNSCSVVMFLVCNRIVLLPPRHLLSLFVLSGVRVIEYRVLVKLGDCGRMVVSELSVCNRAL